MSAAVFALVADYGVWVIAASAFLSCLALPIPTSLMMLTGGAFAAAGDLALWQVMAGAWVGAVFGDQTGYFIGRTGGRAVLDWLSKNPTRAAIITRAGTLIRAKGTFGVFLSTWAVAPLGPWVNVAAGASNLTWTRFTIADVAGEVIWVVLYAGLGALFAANLEQIAALMSNIVGLVVALVVALGAALWIRAKLHAGKAA